jgi:hypothetical protein
MISIKLIKINVDNHGKIIDLIKHEVRNVAYIKRYSTKLSRIYNFGKRGFYGKIKNCPQ